MRFATALCALLSIVSLSACGSYSRQEYYELNDKKNKECERSVEEEKKNAAAAAEEREAALDTIEATAWADYDKTVSAVIHAAELRAYNSDLPRPSTKEEVNMRIRTGNETLPTAYRLFPAEAYALETAQSRLEGVYLTLTRLGRGRCKATVQDTAYRLPFTNLVDADFCKTGRKQLGRSLRKGVVRSGSLPRAHRPPSSGAPVTHVRDPLLRLSSPGPHSRTGTST